MFDIQEGDTVILSSHPIPGNEEPVYRTINRLFQRGANVVYEDLAPVHVSGHASQEELKLMINLVKPEHLIPIHGELRHLKQHARIGKEVGIPEENIAVVENGQVIEFSHGQMRLGERVPGTYVFVEGSGVGEVSQDVMREREKLSQGGVILVSLVLDETTGRLRGEPEIISHGFKLNSKEVVNRLISAKISKANGNMQEKIVKAVRAHVYGETRRRPLIFVNISRT
jgi:ribonuclease J